MTYGTINADLITTSDGVSAAGLYGMKNRIINGDMRIDQRNAGASVTPTNQQYLVDRWVAGLTQSSKYSFQQNAGSVTPPSGFSKYLGITSLSAYTVTGNDTFLLQQIIEGFNVADFEWGTASASPATLSFWVRSSLTGTFGGSIATTKTAVWVMPFTYTISSANTWTYITVAITAPTATGGANTDNTAGVYVRFGLGSAGTSVGGTAGVWTSAGNYTQPTGSTSIVGTNGATFYITGVQLEKGSTVTSFDYRPYGTELALCQRYYYRTTPVTSSRICMAFASTTTIAYGLINFPVTMRSAPSALEQSGTAGNYGIAYLATSSTCSSVPTFYNGDTAGSQVQFTVASGLTAGQAISFYPTSTSGYLGWSAEL